MAATRDVAPLIEGEPLPWCFRCRTFSHVMKDCHIPEPQDDFQADPITIDPSLDDFLFATQREFDRDSRTPTICKRCEDLDIPSLYKLPFQPHFPAAFRTRPVYGEGVDIVGRLGSTGTAEFLSNCPWCRMLVASALRLVPAEWNELQIVRQAEPLLTTSRVPSGQENGIDLPSLLDELGLSTTRQPSLFLGVMETRPTIHDLGVRMGISPMAEGRDAAYGARSVGPQPDYKLLRSWIEECEHDDQHLACGDAIYRGQSSLDIISVVDVYERKVVPYSTLDRPDYVALSYVWGLVTQPSVRPDSALPPLPRTVEDAMVVVEKLGKRYLWVDAICIDQDDAKSKKLQIAIMDRIYSSAWATIFNLSGASADAGLPRVGVDTSRVRQMYVKTPHGEAFLSTLPALPAYAKQSPWTTRAWVLQEAVVSRRRLFFTHSQVYYECARGQRSEAWPQTPKEELLLSHHFHLDVDSLKKGGNINVPYNRVHMYKTLLEEYKRRRMTYFEDSLNAFSALGTALNQAFTYTDQSAPPGGDVWCGLPTYDLPCALGWRSSAPAPRDRRWPSWSWAAYPGPLIQGAVLPPRYHDWQLDEDRWLFFDVHFVAYPHTPKAALYRRNLDEGHRPPWKNVVDDVELLKIEAMPFEDATGLAALRPVPDNSGTDTWLSGFIAEAVVLSLALAGPAKVPNAEVPYSNAVFDVFLGTVKCHLVAGTQAHADVIFAKCGKKPFEALMLHRGEWLKEVVYDLIILEWEAGVAYRVDEVSLKVPGKELAQIKGAKPVRKRFWFG